MTNPQTPTTTARKPRVQREDRREKRADDQREEDAQYRAAMDEGARKLGMDAVRKMTDGQDGDAQDPPLHLEAAGPMHITEEAQGEERRQSDSPPDESVPEAVEPEPRLHGEGP